MWHRRLRLTAGEDCVILEEDAGEGPPCRLAAALVRRGRRPGEGTESGALRPAGAAWKDARGQTLWGWPDEDGVFLLRESAEPAAVAALLPPAASLALALRRAAVEMGAAARVMGRGILAGIADAVAKAAGCRSAPPPAEGPAPGTAQPQVVIVASDDARALADGLALCRSLGTVFSLGGALAAGPVDYYTDVHRRALRLCHVPIRPDLLPGETEVLQAGLGGLGRALGALARPGATPVPVLDRERGLWGGMLADPLEDWCLILAQGA